MANGGYVTSGTGSSGHNGAPSQAQAMLDNFWNKVLKEVQETKPEEFKNQELPLARIKKIMKLDEDVKMISAEAPVLFAKAAEIFIHELTLRAWLHTEDNKRRTLQRNDIAMAISKFDQFDFLIDIVPREELKPAKRASDGASNSNAPVGDSVQYYYQLAQQHQAALQQQGVAGGAPSQIQILQPGTTPSGQTFMTPQGQIIQLAVPNSTAGGSGDGTQSTSQAHMQGNAIQLVSPIVASGGDLVNQNIPLTLGGQQMIRLQSGSSAAPIIIQTPIQTSSGQFITQQVTLTGSPMASGQTTPTTSQSIGRTRMSDNS